MGVDEFTDALVDVFGIETGMVGLVYNWIGDLKLRFCVCGLSKKFVGTSEILLVVDVGTVDDAEAIVVIVGVLLAMLTLTIFKPEASAVVVIVAVCALCGTEVIKCGTARLSPSSKSLQKKEDKKLDYQ
jgi:hypothetical protein